MCELRFPLRLILALAVAATSLSIQAQSSRATSDSDRLFQAFIEDATVVRNQWWEGQLQYLDGEGIDVTLLQGIAAFQPWQDFELGVRLGFGNSDIPNSNFDGSGATDLDAWGKYYLGHGRGATEYAVGGTFTVPTGDDSARLGSDAFGIAGFGSLRHRFEALVLSAHAGFQFNGDGKVTTGGGSKFDLDGELSPMLGVGVIFPASDRVTFVAEANFRGERFEGVDSDARVLAGINWRPLNRGIIRGALAVGLSDGAPDAQLTVGYAANF